MSARMVNFLLDLGMDIDSPMGRDKCTALFFAVWLAELANGVSHVPESQQRKRWKDGSSRPRIEERGIEPLNQKG